MLPHERALVKRLKDKPFALLGLSSDEDEKQTKAQLKMQGITWRQHMMGSTFAPLPTKWFVMGWPTIYVLDHKGVIRYTNVRGAEMDKAVDTLLAEMGQ